MAGISIELWVTMVLALISNVSIVTAVIITNKNKISSIDEDLKEFKHNMREDLKYMWNEIGKKQDK